MKYLKVFTDFAAAVTQLSDAETGRLFRAMLSYAETGLEPTFNGNERFVWPTAKMNIDKQGIAYQNKCAAIEKARENNPNNVGTDNSSKQTDNSSKQYCSELKTVQEKEKDKDKDNKEREKEILKEKEKKVFTPPTLSEVEEYCRSRGSSVDPKTFYDYFTAGNWTDSKGQKVRNWKQKIITWEKGEGRGRSQSVSGNGKKDSKPEPSDDWDSFYAR